MAAGLAILVPVLGRPHRVAPLLKSIERATPQARVLFVCDPDDHNEQEAIRDAGADLLIHAGNYAVKINTAVRATTEPLLFLGADDLHFKPGWLEKAAAHLTGDVKVVGVNDLCSQRVLDGRHATHFLITRDYATLPTIDGGRGPLCEVYAHNYVDDELVATARARGVLAFASDAIVEHLHPDRGNAEWDDTYRRGRAHLRLDYKRFRRRRHLWEGR